MAVNKSTPAIRFVSSEDIPQVGMDLNRLLVQHPIATFFFQSNDDYSEFQIKEGDILILDRSVKPDNHDLVIAVLDGELKLIKINLQSSEEMEVWGVVTWVLHPLPKTNSKYVRFNRL